MDVQSQEMTQEDIMRATQKIYGKNKHNVEHRKPTEESIEDIREALNKSERPIFLVGNGLRVSQNGKGIKEIEKFCQKNAIPIVSTYLAADFFDSTYENYLGVAGLKAARRANIALYNSDQIVAIGTRLATSVIGFEYEKFSPNAKITIIDIDKIEHSKKTRSGMKLIRSDANCFAKSLSENRKIKQGQSKRRLA